MSIANQPVSVSLKADGAIPDDYIYRLTVEQYHGMVRAGILQESEPVELLEGLLVVKMTINPPHRLCCILTRDALRELLSSGFFMDSQNPVTTGDSEPEPDVSVVRGQPRDYADRHPGPQESALVVEVADSSLRRDRVTKKRIYAREGVPVYWIVNLVEGHIEVYTDPSGPADKPDYRQHQDYRLDDDIPVILDGQEIGRLKVRDLLP